MASGVVYDGVTRGEDGQGGLEAATSALKLFSGMKLWFSHAIPSRKWLVENAISNGAEVVPLEKQADVLLVDHLKKNHPPGTHSYRFVELSIKTGQLEDLDNHRVGTTTRAERPVGSVITSPKGGRVPFTEAEDQFLWNMIKPYMNQGGSWKGNEIYKQIERINPRHPFQSWRDRWIKYTQFQNRQVTEQVLPETAGMPASSEPTPARAAPIRPASTQPSPIQSASSTPAPTQPASTQRAPVQSASSPPASAQPLSAQPVRTQTAPSKVSSKPVTLQVTRSIQVINDDSPNPPESSPRKKRKLNPASDKDQALPTTKSASIQQDSDTPREENKSTEPETQIPAANKAVSQRADTSSQRSKSAERPSDLQKSQSSSNSDEAASKTLSTSQQNRLYDASPDIIELSRSDRSAAFHNVAAEYHELSLTGKQWERIWEGIILPKWCRNNGHVFQDVIKIVQSDGPDSKADETAEEPPGDVDEPEGSDSQSTGDIIRCSRCMTDESKIWRFDKEGKPVCQDCRRLMRSGKMVRPSMAWTDVGDDGNAEQSMEEQNSRPETTSVLDVQITPSRADVAVQTSPIRPQTPLSRRQKTPESPSASRLPGPNEARKRTAKGGSQSTSQETEKSDIRIDDDSNRMLESEKPQETDNAQEGQETEPLISTQELPFSPKRKRLRDDPNSLEIPSTPEHAQSQPATLSAASNQDRSESESDSGSASVSGSVHNESEHDPEDADSPLFIPEDEAFKESTGGSLVNFFGGSDGAPISSSLRQQTEDDNLSEAETSSQGYPFETAPEVSEDWETAPETQARNKKRLETQALFDGSVEMNPPDEFALPPPDGGWEMIEEASAPIVISDDNSDEEDKAESEDEDTSSVVDHVNVWLDDMRKQYVGEPGLDRILNKCLHATSFDFRLSTEVVKRMVNMSKLGTNKDARKQGIALLPDDVAGCWTDEDDSLLFSFNARSIDRVQQKHGKENCNSRFNFLEAWQD